MSDTINRSKEIVIDNAIKGSVEIADEVIMSIAALAATDVEGVSSMAGNITNELIAKLGVKNLGKGVKMTLTGEELSLCLAIYIRYGYSIPSVSQMVQEKVKTTVENMTGLSVKEVSVMVSGVDTSANTEV